MGGAARGRGWERRAWSDVFSRNRGRNLRLSTTVCVASVRSASRLRSLPATHFRLATRLATHRTCAAAFCPRSCAACAGLTPHIGAARQHHRYTSSPSPTHLSFCAARTPASRWRAPPAAFPPFTQPRNEGVTGRGTLADGTAFVLESAAGRQPAKKHTHTETPHVPQRRDCRHSSHARVR